jgi:hypothetical protein
MIGGAEELGILAAIVDEDYQLQAHQPVSDPQTKRMLVVTSGVPNLEQAFVASLLAFTENNTALLGLCANHKCSRLFVRQRGKSQTCSRPCYWAHRDQINPAAAAARKRPPKTKEGSKRGRPRKYP